MLSKNKWKSFALSFTYNTNKIEGSKLSFTEVKDIILINSVPAQASREDVEECIGLYKAINYVRKNFNQPITPELIKLLHRMVFHKTKSFAGNFREKPDENIVIVNKYGNIIAKPTSPQFVAKEISDLCNSTNERASDEDEPFRFHIAFENIHPFLDGNGRTGRLLLNLMLLKQGKKPYDIKFEDRVLYYTRLDYPSLENIKAFKEDYEKQQ